MAISNEQFTIKQHQFASRLHMLADPSYNVEYSVPKPTNDPAETGDLDFYLTFVEPNPVLNTPDW